MTDNLELPGLPPAPKKRGRPPTGKAKTAAQRKAAQRAKLNAYEIYGPEDFVTLSHAQIIQVLPRLWSSADYEAVEWACDALKSLAIRQSSLLASP